MSAESEFVNNLLRGGKQAPRFQKRIPSIRTAMKKYESMTFRQRFLALPDEIRNKVYDYIIVSGIENEWILSKNCGAGFIDYSRGFVPHDGGSCADIEFLDDVRTLHSLPELPC
jgi:hypothetical protein